MVRKRWGEDALEKHKNLEFLLGVDIQEGILTWHIGTDIFLSIKKGKAGYGADNVFLKAVREIFNYMMFLLVNRPYMLPGLPQNWMYQVTCDRLVEVWRNKGPTATMADVEHHDSNIAWSTISNEHSTLQDDDSYSSKLNTRDELAKILFVNRSGLKFHSSKNPRLEYAIFLSHRLSKMREDEALKLLLNVWIDILFYAANRCSRESHAKKLTSGSELTTVIWLMAENHDNYFRMLQKVGK